MTINADQIINSFLPTVYIGRVILEGGGSKVARKVSNPHIDWSSDNPSKARLEERFGKERSQTDLNPQNGSKYLTDEVTLTVSLVVRDVVTPNILGLWFRNRNLASLINVKWFWTDDPKAATGPVRWSKSMRFSKGDFPNNLEALKLRGDHKNELSSKSLAEFLPPKGYNNFEQFKETDSDGNEIYTFSIQTKIVLTYTPENFTIFTQCEVDEAALFGGTQASPLGVNFQLPTTIISQISPELLTGPTTHDVIIQDNKTVSTSYAYFLEGNNKQWMGDVHQMPGRGGRWMTGNFHQKDSMYLVRRSVPNTRIQDFRISKYFQKRRLNFFSTEEDILRSFIKNPRNDMLDINRPRTYFSDIHIARDSFGQARFFFSMDWQRIVMDNTLFGSLLAKKNVRKTEQILDYCRIASLKIFRKRITGSPEAGSPPYYKVDTSRNLPMVPFFDPVSTPKDFSCNDSDTLIMVASAPQGGQPINPASYRDYKGRLVCTLENVERLHINSASKNLMHFSGIDRAMREITDGYYQYRIELEIEDNTPTFLYDELRRLYNSRTNLQKYYDKATQLGETGATEIVRDDPHVDFSLLTITNKTPELAFYNPITNQFTAAFTKYMIWNQTLAKHVKDAPEIYLTILALMTKDANFPLQSPDFPTQLKSWISPATGTPTGIKQLINLMDLLIRKLSDTLEIKQLEKYKRHKVPNTAQSPRPPVTLFNQSKPKGFFKLKNRFLTFFNSNLPKGMEYDFLNLGPDSEGTIIKTAEGIDYLKRVELETQKLMSPSKVQGPINLEVKVNGVPFNKDDTPEKTEKTFLSPATVKTGLSKDYDIQLIPKTKSAKREKELSASPMVEVQSEKDKKEMATKGQAEAEGDKKGMVGNEQGQAMRKPKPKGESVQLGILEPFPPQFPEKYVVYEVVKKLGPKNAKEMVSSDMTKIFGAKPGYEEEKKRGKKEKGDSANKSLWNVINGAMANKVATKDNFYARTPSAATQPSEAYRSEALPEQVPIERVVADEIVRESKNCDIGIHHKNPQNPSDLISKVLEMGTTQTQQEQVDLTTAMQRIADSEIYYSPDSSRGIVSIMMNTVVDLGAEGEHRAMNHKNLSAGETYKQTTPNHVKALVAGKQAMHNADVESLAAAKDGYRPEKYKAYLKFFKIAVVEYLHEFQNTDNPANAASDFVGREALQQPVWKMLTNDVWEGNMGKKLLCRLKPYENQLFGYVRDLKTDFPTVDEYFFLDVSTQVQRHIPAHIPPEPPPAPDTYLAPSNPIVGVDLKTDEPVDPRFDKIADSLSAKLADGLGMTDSIVSGKDGGSAGFSALDIKLKTNIQVGGKPGLGPSTEDSVAPKGLSGDFYKGTESEREGMASKADKSPASTKPKKPKDSGKAAPKSPVSGGSSSTLFINGMKGDVRASKGVTKNFKAGRNPSENF